MDEPYDDEPEITEDDFFAALQAGDAEEAAKILRSLGGLGPGAAETLADLLAGDPAMERIFPYRFALVRWREGRPSNFLEREAGKFTLWLAIKQALKTEKKVDLAIAAVAKSTGISPSKLWPVWSAHKEVWSAHKKKTPPNS